MEWGDDIKAISKDEAVMLVNHQATGDVCTLMMCLQDKGLVSILHTAVDHRKRVLTQKRFQNLTVVWSIGFNMYMFPENSENFKKKDVQKSKSLQEMNLKT